MRIGRATTLVITLVVALGLSAACSGNGSHQERAGAVDPPTSAPPTSAPPATAATTPPATTAAPIAALSPTDDWLTYHHDLGRSGVAGDQAPLGAVKKAWTSPALDGPVYAQPLIAGDTAIVVGGQPVVGRRHRRRRGGGRRRGSRGPRPR